VEIDLTNGEQRLTPRGSFAVWKEDVRALARPWGPPEIEAWADLRQTLMLAQHAERQRVLQGLLERSNADLESFAYVVSHDLQEPLRGIRSFAHFLSERLGGQLEAQERRWLDTIMNLTVRMGAQIEALLQYSRAGQQPLALERVDLGALLGRVLEALSARIADSGARVLVAPDLPAIDCDPVRTAAIFENLIGNGIKYNDRTDKAIEVGWRAGPEPVLFVRDNGIGIPERHCEAIFTIFRRLHGRDDYGGGTGAGLTITRKHVERQGGRLWLESTPGTGTTFFFTLAPGRAEPRSPEARS
jgi:light-regulated signal transduction histidine kinase (bacteriophytochrome)